MKKILVTALLSALSVSAMAGKAPTELNEFADYMQQKHGFDKAQIQKSLNKAEKRQSILDAMSRPAEGKDWYQYRPIFMTKERIDKGVAFWQKHEETLARAEKEFKVPAEIIVAIIGVETKYGKIMGSYPVIDAISTLAFHYPKRGKFFAGELEQYFILAREQGWDLTKPKGSYAGAMGMGQFIPTSYRYYAVDFDGDEKINLFSNPVDAIGSVANYFSEHHWKMGQPVVEFLPEVEDEVLVSFKNTKLKPQYKLADIKKSGLKSQTDLKADAPAGIYEFKLKKASEHWLGFHNFYVITRYNRSPMYAMAVHQLSQAIKEKAQQAGKIKKSPKKEAVTKEGLSNAN